MEEGKDMKKHRQAGRAGDKQIKEAGQTEGLAVRWQWQCFPPLPFSELAVLSAQSIMSSQRVTTRVIHLVC